MNDTATKTPTENGARQNTPVGQPSKVALGILILSILELLVGVFNAFSSGDGSIVSSPKADSSVASLLKKEESLLLIKVEGPIFMASPQQQSGFFEMETNAVSARKALDYAAKTDSIKGVLLHINSPGGTVGMSQELHNAVQRVTKKKPVVASMGDMAASGGYYTACAADKIVANPGTLTASIGVIVSNLNMTELFTQKLGIRPVTIKSGRYKDILSAYRTPTGDELALLQKMIDGSYQNFLTDVIAGRTRFITDEAEKATTIEKIKAVADGRIVDGNQGVEAGLVDELGDREYAYDLLDRMAKERFSLKAKDRLPLETMDESFSILDFLGLSVQIPMPHPQASMVNTPLDNYVPFSAHYPNQPLWILE